LRIRAAKVKSRKEGAVTFIEFLKIKKKIDVDGSDLDDLMEEFYGEYNSYMMSLKDGCGPDEMA
jgi:hypothetical protein